MFIFKLGSRNDFNQLRKKARFKQNFKDTFNLDIPHLDTVDLIMRQLDPKELEGLKVYLIKEMINKKTLAKYRFLTNFISAPWMRAGSIILKNSIALCVLIEQHQKANSR